MAVGLQLALLLCSSGAMAADLNQTWPPAFLPTGVAPGSVGDFTIPSGFEGKLLLHVEGGDGGRADITSDCSDDVGSAGPGASVNVEFDVGSAANQIQPGATLKFIVGERGDSVSTSGNNNDGAGAGGGAGTGIYVQQPGSGSTWDLLVGAGGGGGGSVGSSFCVVYSSDGGYARTSIDGLGPIANGGGFGGGLFGFGGREGGYPDDPGEFGGGGGGTLSDGGGYDGAMAFPGLSVNTSTCCSGGYGGEGWGAGGRGSDGYGGGGGGFSGGGGEGFNTSDSGGGGAFISQSFNDNQAAFVFARVARSETRSAAHGLAAYSLQPNYQVSPGLFWAGAAGSVDVEITAALDGTAPWTAVAHDPWLFVDLSSGTGNATVRISFDENTGTGERTGTVTVAGQVVTVRQQPGDNLVTNAGDSFVDFVGSLRQVIESAASGASIHFHPSLSGATIFLDPLNGELVIDKTLTIDATGLDAGLTLDAGGSQFLPARVMKINNGVFVELIGLTLTGGYYKLVPFPGLQGGAVFVDGGVLTLKQCALTGNSADYGGAIHNKDGIVRAINSTFYGNSATLDGGAIRNEGAGALSWLTFSTLSGNSAGRSGGGIINSASGLTIQNSIVAGNTAAAGGPDIWGAVGGSSSLIGNPAGATGLGVGLTNYLTGDPRLAPFADWSGPSASMPPLPGSPVVDVADPAFVQPIDQRGAPRLAGLADIGSVELFGFPQPPAVDTDADMIDDRIEPLYPQFTLGVDDSDLDSDGDGALDWYELAQATDPDDAAAIPVPEPGFFAQLAIGSAFLSLLGLRGRRRRRL